MADNNTFNTTVGALFDGMTNFMTTKTVVGEPIHIGETIILPLVDVSFGMGAGSKAGGVGGKMTPSAILVINNGSSKVVNIKNQDSISKILDMVPDVLNKIFKKNKNNEMTDEEIIEAAKASTNQ